MLKEDFIWNSHCKFGLHAKGDGPTDCMGLFQHLMTSAFSPAKHCPADVSMSQLLQLQGCCSVGDPDLETWRLTQ